MRQKIRASAGERRGPPSRRIAVLGLTVAAATWLTLPAGCGSRSIGEFDPESEQSGGSGNSVGVSGAGGRAAAGGIGGADGAGPIGRGGVSGADPGGRGGAGPSGRGGASGLGPGGAAGVSGAFGAAGFNGVGGVSGAAGSPFTCNPAFCPSNGGGKPCCLLPRDVCGLDYGAGCGLPICNPSLCPSEPGQRPCCVGPEGPCGQLTLEGECQPQRPALCNPAFCPNPGFGRTCCVTRDGPCGIDTGLGCQNMVFDGGFSQVEGNERDAAPDVSRR